MNLKAILIKWWPAILPALVAAYHTAAPHIQAWVAHHPSASVYIATASVFGATLLKSPLAQAALANVAGPQGQK